MGFSGALLDLIGDKDPRLAMLAALGGSGATQQAPGATPGGTAGAPATTGAGGASATPAAYQSPPELMELYTQLIKRTNAEQMLDSGLGLMASAVVRNPSDRNMVYSAVSGAPGGGRSLGSGGGANNPLATMEGFMKLQMTQNALAQRAAQRAALPSIAKQYNIDMPTASYLFDTGKLDSVLSELLKPNKQLTQLANGQHAIVDVSSGKVSDPFGPEKTKELAIEKSADGRLIAIDKETGLPVGAPVGPMEDRTTTEQKNWMADNKDRVARGQSEIGFGEWMITNKRAGAGASNVGPNNVDYGKPPTDMQWARDANGQIIVEGGIPKATIIPGSKTDIKNQKKDETDTTKDNQKTLTQTFVDRNIDDVFTKLNTNKDSWTTPMTGFLGDLTSHVKGTEAYNIGQALNTIKSNIGFEKLQQMRENSPTGGALGQVSDFENKLLQSTFGSLEQGQSREDFIRNLTRVKVLTSAIVNGVKGEAVSQESYKKLMDEADAASAAMVAKLKGQGEEKKPDAEAPAPIDDVLSKYPPRK